MKYEKYLSDRAKEIKPSGIREFFDIVNTMKDAISLGVGEPDFITPWIVRDSAIKSIQKGFTQYTSNSGLLKLRELIKEYIKVRTKLSYDENSEIIVTAGASEAIDITLRALINQGDEVLVPEPSYVSYCPCVTLCGGKPVAVECKNEDQFKLMPENIEKVITEKTKAIIIPYPNNPTGAIMTKEDLEKIIPVIKKHDLIVISDEIYSELTYEKEHVSIASLDGMKERTIMINGFSKSFAMTGWRLGYLLAPKEITSVILKIHQYVIMCAPTCAQFAAITALEQGLKDDFKMVEVMRNEYNQRRRFLYNEFNDMGLECFEPLGAFYAFPKVSSTGMDGDKFARGLLKEKKIAVVPGVAFGDCGTEHIRVSYAYSMQSLTKAMNKIREYVEKLKG